MRATSASVVSVLLIVCSWHLCLGMESQDMYVPPIPPNCVKGLPAAFRWGASTSAYQIEGSWNVSGKAPSVWDTYFHNMSSWPSTPAPGDAAIDFYNRYPTDIALMKSLGLKHFRLSIAWTRIIPEGVAGSPVNKEGINFYRSLFAELHAAGIEPLVTLHHFDTPQVLQTLYGGFQSARIIEDFNYYANTTFREFGDLVKLWITINEPWTYCSYFGPEIGVVPGSMYSFTNDAPYVCAKNVLLAHATAVNTFRTKYPKSSRGRISITLSNQWFEPLKPDSQLDLLAASCITAVEFGQFANPLVAGGWPDCMKNIMGPLLPSFSAQESKLITGSYDFLGINHYTSLYAYFQEAMPPFEVTNISAKGVMIGRAADQMPGYSMFQVPWGFRKLLNNVKNLTKNAELWVTENGINAHNEALLPFDQIIHDGFRTDWVGSYINELCAAIKDDGVNVKAYYVWSILDNVEWLAGFTTRFGLTYVNTRDGSLNRTPKSSAYFMSRNFYNRTKAYRGRRMFK